MGVLIESESMGSLRRWPRPLSLFWLFHICWGQSNVALDGDFLVPCSIRQDSRWTDCTAMSR